MFLRSTCWFSISRLAVGRGRLAEFPQSCSARFTADARHGRARGPPVGTQRLRLRLFSTAGGLAVSARRVVLHLARTNNWSALLVAMLARLRALPAPSG